MAAAAIGVLAAVPFGCSSGPSARARFIKKADPICNHYDGNVKRAFKQAFSRVASSTNDDEQRQILIDSFAHASTMIRNEARELRRLKAPPDAGGGWFRVLVQMRSDAQLFEFASNDLRRGPTYGAPFQHADPAVMRFVRSYGFKVCGKALRLGYG